MNDSDVNYIDISVPANLEAICKYHKNSEVFKNEKTISNFSKEVRITVLPIDAHTIHPAYSYKTIVDKTFPIGLDKVSHGNNILAMVSNIIEVEWSYFLEHVVSINQNKFVTENEEESKKSANNYDLRGTVNLARQVLPLLESLNRLLLIKNSQLENTDFVISAAKTKGSQSSKLEKGNPTGKIVLEGKEKAEIIEIMIQSRIKLIKDYSFLLDDLDFDRDSDVIVTELRREISKLKKPKTIPEIFHLLKKHICHAVLFYLRVEMGWHKKKIVLNENQGEYIYTVLLLFNLISTDELSRHHRPRDKARYISSFFKKDSKLRDIKFPVINFHDVPLPKPRSLNATQVETN